MRKTCTIAVTILAAGMMLVGNTAAQQTAQPSAPAAPAAKTQQAAPAAKTQQSTATASKTAKPAAAKSSSAVALTTQKDKVSYAIGLNIGRNLQKDSVEVAPNLVTRGIQDGLAGGKALLTDDQVQAALVALNSEVEKRKGEVMAQAGEENKKAGDAFLAANKTKEGVVTLPDGLQYKILQHGTGPKPTASDTVVCNYRGTLIGGKEFDSSYKRGQPASFPVGQVIPAWTEALQLMPVGSKWELFIPSELAYGARGAGADIGPNSTLIFEVELLSIKGK
jgi:FKBP-type peptidyl-prolyl cis-trans isomerase FklB